jgi:hypothetical protein
VLVIPCYQPYLPRIDGDEPFYQATLYGSIFPAVWNFQLALQTRGYGTCVTTLHFARTPSENCCRSRKATRKAAYFPSVASARVIPSGPRPGARLTKSLVSTAGTARHCRYRPAGLQQPGSV